jgi:hypothetical protein
MVRRTTIRKRMRAKLRQVKQQLCERMHDPVPQTGRWLKSVVQGYFNYYAAFLAPSANSTPPEHKHPIPKHPQTRQVSWYRISWTRILEVAQRWIPQPRALHPFPDARFAATHPK